MMQAADSKPITARAVIQRIDAIHAAAEAGHPDAQVRGMERELWFDVLGAIARGEGDMPSVLAALAMTTAVDPPAVAGSGPGLQGAALRAFRVWPTVDGRVGMGDPNTGEVEVVAWDAATEMGLWPTRIYDRRAETPPV